MLVRRPGNQPQQRDGMRSGIPCVLHTALTGVLVALMGNRPAGLSITHHFVVREARILTNKMYKKRQLW